MTTGNRFAVLEEDDEMPIESDDVSDIDDLIEVENLIEVDKELDDALRHEINVIESLLSEHGKHGYLHGKHGDLHGYLHGKHGDAIIHGDHDGDAMHEEPVMRPIGTCFQHDRSGQPLRAVAEHPLRDPPALTRRPTFHEEENRDKSLSEGVQDLSSILESRAGLFLPADEAAAPKLQVELSADEEYNEAYPLMITGGQCACKDHDTSAKSKRRARRRCDEKAPEMPKFLMPLKAVAPPGVNAVSKGRAEWECVEFAMDSGATDSVMNGEELEGVEITEGLACKKGIEYEVANGIKIPNEGEKAFEGHSEEGVVRRVTAQVCAVTKALMSVKRVVAAGHRVVFDDKSYVEDLDTGERMYMEEKDGMYILKLWVRNGDF